MNAARLLSNVVLLNVALGKDRPSRSGCRLLVDCCSTCGSHSQGFEVQPDGQNIAGVALSAAALLSRKCMNLVDVFAAPAILVAPFLVFIAGHCNELARHTLRSVPAANRVSVAGITDVLGRELTFRGAEINLGYDAAALTRRQVVASSSAGPLSIIVPVGIPLIAFGDVSAVAVDAALAVSSAVVEVSPFSTNDALMVANRPDAISEEKYSKQVLSYSVLVTLAGPLLVWAAIVVPGWN
jgi:hypothetical protein